MIPYINIHTHFPGFSNNIIGLYNTDISRPGSITGSSYYSAGIHPWFIDVMNHESQFESLEKVASHAACLAIGECGLDRLKGPEMVLQEQVFEQQILLAIALNKPIIVHCVRAFDVLHKWLKKYQHQANFIIHGFNQNDATAKQLVQFGAYLSFGAALLQPNMRLRAIFATSPMDKIFLENDTHDSAIEKIYDVAAALKGCKQEEFKAIIFTNFNRIFNYE